MSKRDEKTLSLLSRQERYVLISDDLCDDLCDDFGVVFVVDLFIIIILE